MAVTGWPKFCKYLLFVANLINLCFAVCVICIQTWIAVMHWQHFDVQEVIVTVSTFCWIVIGIFGCYGSYKENILFLYIYLCSVISLAIVRTILRVTLNDPDTSTTLASQTIQLIYAFLPAEIPTMIHDLVYSLESLIFIILASVLIRGIKSKQELQIERA